MRIVSAALAAIAGVTRIIHAAPSPVTTPADVSAAAATALSSSPTSHVEGKAFQRYVSIWFENTDFDMAAADPNFAFFAEQGLVLENMFSVTHPSEPNYMAAFGGDYFGLDGDGFTQVPQNISTVVDLLEDKGISWGFYQEDMPYTGYQGFEWVNQVNGANDYVRKHNPGILYNSLTTTPTRLTCIKNTTLFHTDLSYNTLPQWLFITPNMTSDGHDTSVTTAGAWLRTFLTPLLSNPNFLNSTLIHITFDESETYAAQNRVFSILLGDALPTPLVNTTDSNFYDHYSEIATVEANWGLFTLGRWDVGANVFGWVAGVTGDVVRVWDGNGMPGLEDTFLNASYPGIFNGEVWAEQPVPNSELVVNGREVLPKVREEWGGRVGESYYRGQLEIPSDRTWGVVSGEGQG